MQSGSEGHSEAANLFHIQSEQTHFLFSPAGWNHAAIKKSSRRAFIYGFASRKMFKNTWLEKAVASEEATMIRCIGVLLCTLAVLVQKSTRQVLVWQSTDGE